MRGRMWMWGALLVMLAACDDASSGSAGSADADGGVGGAGGLGGAGGEGGWGGDDRGRPLADAGGGGWGGQGGQGGQGGEGGAGGGWDGWGGEGGDGGQGGEGGGGGSPGGNTNINLGGAQDFGYFRRLLNEGRVPTLDDFDAQGFFAEHHTPLPTPDCGERVCLQAMLGVMGNLINGNNCTLLQLGLNSPLVARPDQRPPLNLVVVVDVSGSMSADGKIDFVRQGLSQMVNELNDDDQLALVAYSTAAELRAPLQPLRGRRNELQRLIVDLRPGGSTNIYAGLEEGYREALRHYDSGRQNRLIMLSDGQATAGRTDDASILELSRLYNSEGVGLTTVGLGTDFNLRLMRGLAEQGDGNFYFVEHAAAVEEVFTEELSYFTVPVAFDLELTMREGSDYRYLRAYGSSLWEDTAEGGRLQVPSVFLAHRVRHDDVGPGNGRRGGGSALLVELMPDVAEQREPGESRVATVDVRFREPGTDRIVEQTVHVTYPELAGVLRPAGFFDNPIVTKSFVMLNIYVALEMSVEAFHRGNPEFAVGLLQRLIAAVADYEDSANGGEGDVDMQLDIELMQQLINVMLAQGATEPEEPDIPEDPWPAD